MERRSFHVADVALDAGKAQGDVAGDAPERRRDGVPLDPVAHHGAGRVGLDVVEVFRAAARAGGGLPHERHLRVPGGRGDVAALGEADAVVGGAGGVHCRGLDHRADAVAVALGRRQWLDREAERAFGAQVAVGLRVEGVALAVRADDAERVEADAESGGAQVVDGPDDGLFAVAAAERVHRRVQGGEAR